MAIDNQIDVATELALAQVRLGKIMAEIRGQRWGEARAVAGEAVETLERLAVGVDYRGRMRGLPQVALDTIESFPRDVLAELTQRQSRLGEVALWLAGHNSKAAAKEIKLATLTVEAVALWLNKRISLERLQLSTLDEVASYPLPSPTLSPE